MKTFRVDMIYALSHSRERSLKNDNIVHNDKLFMDHVCMN